MAVETFRLSLGPLLFNWPVDTFRDFYFRIADEADIDIVYLGEVVCAKRRPFHLVHYEEIIHRLRSAGKQVILSGLQLVMDGKDMASVEETLTLAEEYLIEANDMSTISLLKDRPHALGPSINIYNPETLAHFEHGGATRTSLNAELPKSTLAALATAAKGDLEVQVFGRAPLAISARCFHARANHLTKSGCRYVCENDPDGLTLDTLDGQAFLAINGLQTLSYKYISLLDELPVLMQMGIRDFRLSPHTGNMAQVANIFRARAAEWISGEKACALLDELLPDVQFSNGFFHGQPGHTQRGAVD
ncbi:ubiquinone anaerobic biosynthesis protein UbiV [Kordiimonas sp.]|uniref:ubiquinone anaerobic biosynthesis protein UbiV n=1 Tax=Kordiimonas sp. TaxID=1970157 RepID=UPI003A8F0F37